VKKRNRYIIAVAAVLLCMVVAVIVFTGNGGRLNIGIERQFVWNSSIFDSEKTDADMAYHSPIRQDIVLTTDREWEGNIADSFNIIADEDGYKMYYATYDTKDDVKICYAYSQDGINWDKPDVNVVNYKGSVKNNILLNSSHNITNGFLCSKIQTVTHKLQKSIKLLL